MVDMGSVPVCHVLLLYRSDRFAAATGANQRNVQQGAEPGNLMNRLQIHMHVAESKYDKCDE